MELTGETTIAAPREAVWAALNDPAVLARCIEGVESLERQEGDRFVGTLNAKVGPVRAKFSGTVTLSDLDPPSGYTIAGEGKGGVAGFARGSAKVRLEDAGGGTRLTYQASSNVGGKLAQLGSRMIEGVAKGYADTFFTRLKAELETPSASADELAAVSMADMPIMATGNTAAEASAALAAAEIGALPPSDFAAPSRKGLSPAVWAIVAIAAILIVVLLLK